MTMIKTVALAGASGNIGAPILKALLEANFEVTVLTRPSSESTFPSAVKVPAVDYSDVSKLASVLQGQDALICAFGYAAIKSQETLIDAAIAAGVKRIIPSEFGADTDLHAVRHLPVFAHKVQVAEHLQQKVRGTPTTYTLICNNEFFDWDLDHNFGLDIKNKAMEVFDGGDTAYTATPLDFVATGVVAILQHLSETTNRAVRLHGTTLTQNKLLDIVQRYTGKEGWQISHANTAEREELGHENLKKDPNNFWGWAIPFLQCAIWAKASGGDFSQNNDNELLGLKEMTDAEVEEVVRTRT